MSKKDLGEAKDIQVDTLSDEDLESAAGGAVAYTDHITECYCTVPSTACCPDDSESPES